MTTVSNDYPVNGVGPYNITFEYQQKEDVDVLFRDLDTQELILQPNTSWSFQNATTVLLNAEPGSDVDLIRIARTTSLDPIRSVFYPGSAIRAQDLNENFEQLLFGIQESEFKDGEALGELQDQIDALQDLFVEDVIGADPITTSRVDQTVTVGIKASSPTQDGTISKEDKEKLDNIAEGAQVVEIIGIQPVNVSSVDRTKPEISMPPADPTQDGYMPKEYAEKLDSVEFVEVHNATFSEPIDGVRKTFTLDHSANSAFDLVVSVNGVLQQPNVHFTFDGTTDEITFASAPPVNSEYWITISGFQRIDGTVRSFQTSSSLPLDLTGATTIYSAEELVTQDDFNVWAANSIQSMGDVDLSNYTQMGHLHPQYVLISNLPTYLADYIDSAKLEYRLSLLPTVPVNVATIEDIENRINAITPTELPTNLITEVELETRLSQLPESSVTQHDVDMAAAAVDAKFDMLRAAIREATDFDTLKARLLAVLG